VCVCLEFEKTSLKHFGDLKEPSVLRSFETLKTEFEKFGKTSFENTLGNSKEPSVLRSFEALRTKFGSYKDKWKFGVKKAGNSLRRRTYAGAR
jgi:hypothetical protein